MGNLFILFTCFYCSIHFEAWKCRADADYSNFDGLLGSDDCDSRFVHEVREWIIFRA